ncbi:MFS transporter [Demequina flava]|uniref:MFS transporter n=1 Tax=Demequina flava TaxID=1095025 RepID=UPI000782AD08|nr:MFS transporter [Demequina flava]
MTLPRESTLTEQALVLSAFIGASQLTWGALAPVLPLYAREFGTSIALLGPALAAFALGRAIIGIPAGIMMKWWRPRPYLFVTATGLIVTTVATALVSSPTHLVALRLIAGLFGGATITIAFAVLIAGAPASRRGSVIATATVVQLSAAAIGSFVGGWVADTWGLRWVFPVIVVPLLAVMVWDVTRPARHYWAATRGGEPATQSRSVEVTETPRRQRSSIAWVITVLAVVSFAAFFARFGGEQGLIPTMAYDIAKVSPTMLGVMLAVGTGLSIATLGPIGRAVNRGARLSVFLPATAFAILAVMLFPLANEPWVFGVLIAAYSVSSAVSGMVPAVVTADRVPRRLTGTAVGITRTAGDAGAVVGPLVVLTLYGQGSVWWALASIGVVLTLSAILFIPIARKSARAQDSVTTATANGASHSTPQNREVPA